MLRVSDVWERALHAPGVAVATPDELESAIALSLPERLSDLDDCPSAGEATIT